MVVSEVELWVHLPFLAPALYKTDVIAPWAEGLWIIA